MFEESVAKFAALLTCPLCTTMYMNPYTVTECGHIFCRDCVMEKIEEQCKCPICNLPIFVKNLKKNASIATIVACVRGIQRALVAEKEKGDVVDDMVEVISSGHGPVFSNSALPLPVESTVIAEKPKKRPAKPKITKPVKEQSDAKAQREVVKPTKKTKLKSIGLVLTGVNTDDKQIIYSSHHTIQPDQFSSLVYADYESFSCTHVIAGVNEEGLCQRTVKYLLAILDGKWIVSVDWYLRSLSFGQWLPEAEYEVKGDQINGYTSAPKKGRQTPYTLLKNITFYIEHDLDPKGPRREELYALIRAGGGTILTRRPADSSCMIIKDENDKKRLLNMISLFDTAVK